MKNSDKIQGGQKFSQETVDLALMSTELRDLSLLTDQQLALLDISVETEVRNRKFDQEKEAARVCIHKWRFSYTESRGDEKGADIYKCKNNCHTIKTIDNGIETITVHGQRVKVVG